jgi:hypothetical protein
VVEKMLGPPLTPSHGVMALAACNTHYQRNSNASVKLVCYDLKAFLITMQMYSCAVRCTPMPGHAEDHGALWVQGTCRYGEVGCLKWLPGVPGSVTTVMGIRLA